MMGAKLNIKQEGSKIIYTYEFPDESIAKLTYNAIKQNPQFLAQFEQFRAIIKKINFKLEGNKIIQVAEFKNEKSAECFYYLQKEVVGGQNGES